MRGNLARQFRKGWARSRRGVYPFVFASGFPNLRALSTKSCATGLSVRFFRVTIPFGTPAIGNSTGKTTVPEFVAYVKANPDKISMASAGIGTSGHVAGELFKMMAHVDMVHVPYRGGAPAIIDLLGGQVQVLFDPVSSSTEYIRAGKLRALAVTTASRSEAFPDIPTVAEFVPGYDASAFFGVGAPKNTPADIIERLNKEINAGLADPKLKARLADLGGTVIAGSLADFGKLIAAETEKWAMVVKFAGIKPG
jgi:tripartite-type tricarboxylate transporter receptor subunit TctC